MGERITLNHITKIEGHASLDLQIENGKLVRCDLGSIEGSRYFQALLKGRKYTDAPEITSRICGICSSAHGVCSVMAMENALGIVPSKQTLDLRELQTIGERIRSHATHLYFLALPDFLNFESAIEMAPHYKEEMARALRLVKLGNDLIALISGRIMHQISTTIGGFTHFPTQEELDDFKQRLVDAKDDILTTASLFATLKVPDIQSDTTFFCLTRKGEYAVSYGDVQVGDTIYKQNDYDKVIKEYHNEYSNANFVVIDGKSYYVGALARINNNFESLSDEAKLFMEEVDFTLPEFNPFMNNLSQAVELIHHRESGIAILSNLKIVNEDIVKPTSLHSGHGIAANEAPRGTLWHEYKLDDEGIITYANIVAPTTQALLNMQNDIAKLVQQMIDGGESKDSMVLEVEKLIRSYDPCFSCATHFLEVKWH